MEDQNNNSEDSKEFTQNPEALVKAEDVKQVQIKNSLDKRTKRTAYKDEHGKFVKTSEAIAKLSAKKAAALIMAPSADTPELTAYEALLKNMMEVATKNTDPKNLIGVAKAVKTLEDATGITAAREAMLKDQEPINHGVRLVIVTNPIVDRPPVSSEEKSKPTKPSFATDVPYIDAEIISQKGAARPQSAPKPKRDRRSANVPELARYYHRRAEDTCR
jgi:hypothetical protein